MLKEKAVLSQCPFFHQMVGKIRIPANYYGKLKNCGGQASLRKFKKQTIVKTCKEYTSEFDNSHPQYSSVVPTKYSSLSWNYLVL